jgi:signal peptidase
MQKLLKIGYWVVAAVIMAVAVLMIVTLFPITGNYKIKIVMSGSMEPAIHTGSIVVIKPESSYKIGDVITFGKDTKKDVPTTHRIMEMRAEEGKYVYRTKGDANKSDDVKEISESEVIGKVLVSVPFLGFVLDFAKKPLGFMLLVVVPAIAIIFDEAGNIWKEIKKTRLRPLTSSGLWRGEEEKPSEDKKE